MFTFSAAFISELIIYLAGGFWFWYQGFSIGHTILLVIAIAIGFRAFLVLATFLISWSFRVKPTVPLQINAFQTLNMMLSEFWALLKLSATTFPFEPWLGLREPPVSDRKGIPILLVHGFFCNGAYWAPMIKYLKKQGITNLFTLSLVPVFDDIDKFAEQVATKVEHILSVTGADKIILIGHSMGGLVSRAYLYRLGGKSSVLKLITLGSPHHGTAIAYFMGGLNVKQMRPQSAWLNELHKLEAQTIPIPTTCIYSCHDNFISPQDSGSLPLAKNIPVPGTGHIEMTFSKAFRELVYEEIIKAK